MLILCHHRRLVYGRVLDVLLLKCHVTSHYNLVLVLIITPSEFVPPPDPGAITLCLTFRHDRSHLQKLPLCLTTPGGMFQKGKKKRSDSCDLQTWPGRNDGSNCSVVVGHMAAPSSSHLPQEFFSPSLEPIAPFLPRCTATPINPINRIVIAAVDAETPRCRNDTLVTVGAGHVTLVMASRSVNAPSLGAA